jgi:hypothetical protein
VYSTVTQPTTSSPGAMLAASSATLAAEARLTVPAANVAASCVSPVKAAREAPATSRETSAREARAAPA